MIEIANEGASRKSITYVLIAAFIAVVLACVAGGAVHAFAADEEDANAQPEKAPKAEVQAKDADDEEAEAEEADDAKEEKADKNAKAVKTQETATKDDESDDDEGKEETKEEAKDAKASNSNEKSENKSPSTSEVKTQDDPKVVVKNAPDSLVADTIPYEVDVTITDVDVNKVTIESSNATSLKPVENEGQEGGKKWLTPISGNDYKFSIAPLAMADSAVTITIKEDGAERAKFDVKIEKRGATIVTNGLASKATITVTKGTVEVKKTSYDGTSPNIVTMFDVVLDDKEATFIVKADGYEDKTDVKIDAGKGSPGVVGAKLTPHPYNITYKLNDSKDAPATNDPENPSTYTITDKDITILDPTRDEDLFVFEGWTYTGQTTAKKNPVIKSGSHQDYTFVAKWKTLKTGMTATLKPESPSITYDAKWHSPSDFGFTFTVTKGKNTAKAKSYKVLYSKDGETYTTKEADITFRDAGEHTLYYKIVDGSEGYGSSDREYKSYEGKATLKINTFDTVTDTTTNIVAKGDIFKKYTTDGQIVQVETANLTDSSDESSHVAELKKKYFNSNTMSAFKVYDVSLFLLDRDDETDKELTSDFGNLALTFPVDSSLNGKGATVYELHDNGSSVTEIPFKNLKVSDGKVGISGVTKLSEFVVVVSKTQSSPGTSSSTSSTTKSSTAAKTGDTIAPWIPVTIAVVAVALIVLAVFRIRKLR